jgi:hypothetical protein
VVSGDYIPPSFHIQTFCISEVYSMKRVLVFTITYLLPLTTSIALAQKKPQTKEASPPKTRAAEIDGNRPPSGSVGENKNMKGKTQPESQTRGEYAKPHSNGQSDDLDGGVYASPRSERQGINENHPSSESVGKARSSTGGRATSRQPEDHSNPVRMPQNSKGAFGAGAQALPGDDSAQPSVAKSAPKTQSKMKNREQREERKQMRTTKNAYGAGAQALPGGDSTQPSAAKSAPKTQSKMKNREHKEDGKQ